MSDCNLTSDCHGEGDGGCFANCCDVTCPPDDLCDYVEITYKCGPTGTVCQTDKDQLPCNCPTNLVKRFFGFVFPTTKKLKNKEKITESHLQNKNELLGIENIPPHPNFKLDQNLIKLENSDSQFVFGQEGGTSVPCSTVTVTITTSNSCGISTGGKVGGSKCCCSGGGNVTASLSGGEDCEITLSWTEQEGEDGDTISFPSLQPANSCCSCTECGKTCGSNTPLWKKRLVGDKLRVNLDKKEFARRVNRLKKIRINKRIKNMRKKD